MTVLAILVDPMADVWMASMIIPVLARMDSKRPSQTLARSSVETSMIAAQASGVQMECAVISPMDSSARDDGYQVRDGDSASADRICLPVACPIPSMDGVVAGPDSLHFPQSLFIECAAQLVHPAATGGVHPAGTSHITTTCEALLELSRLLVKACFHALKEVLK